MMGHIEGRGGRREEDGRDGPGGLVHVAVATIPCAAALVLTAVAYPDLTPGHMAALVLGGGLLLMAVLGGTIAATTEPRRSGGLSRPEAGAEEQVGERAPGEAP